MCGTFLGNKRSQSGNHHRLGFRVWNCFSPLGSCFHLGEALAFRDLQYVGRIDCPASAFGFPYDAGDVPRKTGWKFRGWGTSYRLLCLGFCPSSLLLCSPQCRGYTDIVETLSHILHRSAGG